MPRNFKYTDSSEFQYDLAPTNVARSGRTGEPWIGRVYMGSPHASFELAYILFEQKPDQYNSWGNWIEKFQPDYRFLALSDKNAETYLFPNVDDPWMFTEYIYQGKDDDKIIEPPLFDDNLQLINDVESKRISSVGWQNNNDSENNNFPTDYDGVRLYKQKVKVQCVKWGQHGNIPPHVLTTTAPKSWIEPEGLLTSKLVPKITMRTGHPIFASSSDVPGIIDDGGYAIKKINYGGSEGEHEWNKKYNYSEGQSIKQEPPKVIRTVDQSLIR